MPTTKKITSISLLVVVLVIVFVSFLTVLYPDKPIPTPSPQLTPSIPPEESLPVFMEPSITSEIVEEGKSKQYEPIGLVARWTMDNGAEGVQDITGNGNNGILRGDFNVVDGKVGTALHMDNSYVDIRLGDTVRKPELSVVAWAKLDENHKGGTILKAKPQKPIGTPGGVSLEILPEGNPVFSKGNVDGTITKIVGDKLSPNKWHYLVGIYNGRQLNLYTDGVLVEPGIDDSKKIAWLDQSEGGNPTSAKITIGGSLKGSIDEIQMYDFALSKLNVEYLYNHLGGVIG